MPSDSVFSVSWVKVLEQGSLCSVWWGFRSYVHPVGVTTMQINKYSMEGTSWKRDRKKK